jgi:uncharacterized Zn finger protein (UPF0148 family)
MSEIDDLVSSMHEHLEATEEKALTEEANRKLGEAQSIAADIAESNLDQETTTERVETVLELLEAVGSTGDETADEHVDAARRAAERVLDR